MLERFELNGAETQLQELKYTGTRARTFTITVHAQMDLVGGGAEDVELAIQVNNVTITNSEKAIEVGHHGSTPHFATTTLVLEPDDTVQLVVANLTSTANLVIQTVDWNIGLSG